MIKEIKEKIKDLKKERIEYLMRQEVFKGENRDRRFIEKLRFKFKKLEGK